MRLTMDREFYLPKSNIEQVLFDKTRTLTIYFFQLDGKPAVKSFYGKRAKPQKFHTFKTVEAREKWTADYFRGVSENIASMAKYKQEQREERTTGAAAFAAEIKIGDLFHCGWGYSMSLNSYYQVTALHGRKLEVIEAGAEYISGGGYNGYQCARRITDAEEIARRPKLTATICGRACISVKRTGSRSDSASPTTESEQHYYNTMD